VQGPVQETAPQPTIFGEGVSMSEIYLGIGLALVLVFCGAASAATIPVNQLSGDFQGTTFTENCGLGGSLLDRPLQTSGLGALPRPRSDALHPHGPDREGR